MLGKNIKIGDVIYLKLDENQFIKYEVSNLTSYYIYLCKFEFITGKENVINIWYDLENIYTKSEYLRIKNLNYLSHESL